MQHYLHVDIEEDLNFYEIATAIQQLSKMPGFSFRYLMVHVHTDTCRLSYKQLCAIISDAQKCMLNNRTLKKTALVVNTGLQSGITRLFMEGVKDLACAFAVFRDRELALDWFFKPSA